MEKEEIRRIKPLSYLLSKDNMIRDIILEIVRYKWIFHAYAIVLLISYLISLFWNSSFISWMLSNIGCNLLLAIFLVAMIFIHEIPVELPIKVQEGQWLYETEYSIVKVTKKFVYSCVWSVCLIAVAVIFFLYAKSYRNNYAFNVSDFYYLDKSPIYHNDHFFDKECQEFEMDNYGIDGTYRLIKGVDARNLGLSLCECCKESMEDAQSSAAESIYRR